jgi:hypothetical protein
MAWSRRPAAPRVISLHPAPDRTARKPGVSSCPSAARRANGHVCERTDALRHFNDNATNGLEVPTDMRVNAPMLWHGRGPGAAWPGSV